MQGDNTGDNISKYNSIFCEMTAVYWAWKNLNADYIGLCHYRRVFSSSCTSIQDVKGKYKTVLKGLLFSGNYVNQIAHKDNEQFINDALVFGQQLKNKIDKEGYDLIVPSPYIFFHTNVQNLFDILHRDNVSMIKEIVRSNYPQMYPFLQKTLCGKRLYAANMFIMKKSVFDEYCNFVFSVLFSHISQVIDKKWCVDPYSEGCFARVSGYMAEILTSTFIEQKKEEGLAITENKTAFLNL